VKQPDLSNINVLRVRHTLELATQAYAQLKRQIPREKISKRIEELKYLTTQKTVPRLSIRKEVLHLEEQISSILHVEKALEQQSHKESERITALKKQNTFLRKQIAVSGDKDLHQKVDRLSHLLAEAVARKDIRRDVALSQRISTIVKPKLATPLTTEAKPSVDLLQQKLSQLKHLLEQQKERGAAVEVILLLEDRVKVVEEKINSLKQEKPVVKHTMIMSAPLVKKVEIVDQELAEFPALEDKE